MEITPEFVLQWHRELNQVIPGQPVSIESFLESLPVVSELPPLPPATRVLVRGDVDAGIRNETVINGTRLQSMLQTLRYGIEKGWAARWQANGWMRNKKERALNPDMWERLLKACNRHDVRFEWIRGHTGHPDNERCDELANNAARGGDQILDEGFIETGV